MSCAALSIRAVRMAERGTDTRSDTDDSGGASLSAADADRGQSSRHRDTIESTITCKMSGISDTGSSEVGHSVKRERELWHVQHLQLFVCSFGKFTSQRVQTLPHRPVHRQDMSQLTQRRVQLRDGEREREEVPSYYCESNAKTF